MIRGLFLYYNMTLDDYLKRYKFNRRLFGFPDEVVLGDRKERKRFLWWLNGQLDKRYYNFNKGE